MKSKIHPKYYPEAKVTCACGNTFNIGSTLPEINVDICSQCHPFFTGEMRLVDTQGRIEKFEAKRNKAVKGSKSKDKKVVRREKERPQSLKEMLKKELEEQKDKDSEKQSSKKA